MMTDCGCVAVITSGRVEHCENRAVHATTTLGCGRGSFVRPNCSAASQVYCSLCLLIEVALLKINFICKINILLYCIDWWHNGMHLFLTWTLVHKYLKHVSLALLPLSQSSIIWYWQKLVGKQTGHMTHQPHNRGLAASSGAWLGAKEMEIALPDGPLLLGRESFTFIN